ncbi:LPP20 family lipoprotein [bacterium]|nr:LPP20 family lipoprotein [bacterium]
MKKLFITLLLVFAVSACGSTKKTTRQTVKRKDGKIITIQTGVRPDWVDGRATQYPNALYVTAVGHGRNRDDAENDARGSMSNIFYSKVESVSQSMKSVSSIKKNGKMLSSEVNFDADQYTKVSTESVFKGMFLSEYWQDENGTIYVLATIKRSQVIPALEEAIDDLDKYIKKTVDEAKASEDQMSKTKKLYKAIEKATLREYYNSQLSILDFQGKTIPTEYSVNTLVDMLDSQLETLNIAVVISGEGGSNIKNIILEVGTNMDLKIYGDESVDTSAGSFESFDEDENSSKKDSYATDADILISGDVSFKALDRGDPKYQWVEGSVNLQIKNNKTGKTYKNISISEREGRKTLPEAKRMAARSLSKKLKTELGVTLKKALSGL